MRLTTMTNRKQYTAAFKAQIVQQVLREDKTLAQIASEHGVHPNQISMDGKGRALDNIFTSQTRIAETLKQTLKGERSITADTAHRIKRKSRYETRYENIGKCGLCFCCPLLGNKLCVGYPASLIKI